MRRCGDAAVGLLGCDGLTSYNSQPERILYKSKCWFIKAFVVKPFFLLLLHLAYKDGHCKFKLDGHLMVLCEGRLHMGIGTKNHQTSGVHRSDYFLISICFCFFSI